MSDRPSWHSYWMGHAQQASTRATCLRRKVGAVIVVNNRLVSTGYNGAPAGMPQCIDDGVGCEMEHGHCVRTVHAELNAALFFDTHRYRGTIASLYTTASPCRRCMMSLVNVGVRHIVYRDQYKDPTHDGDKSRWALDTAEKLGIKMDWLSDPVLPVDNA
jgi:dCMP deaminase